MKNKIKTNKTLRIKKQKKGWIKDLQKRNIEVFFTTVIGELDDDDVFLSITASIEKKFEEAIGKQHIINRSFSLLSKEMKLKIDDNFEIIVRGTGFKEVGSEPLTKMTKVMKLYKITKTELERIYENDPSLLDVPEPMMYIHECVAEFEIGNCRSRKYETIAHNLIDLILETVGNKNRID